MAGPQVKTSTRHRPPPCRRQGRRKVVHLHLYRNPFFRLPSTGAVPFNRWERELCHPFAAAEVNRAIWARTTARADSGPLYLLGLALAIPTLVFLFGFVNNFIR